MHQINITIQEVVNGYAMRHMHKVFRLFNKIILRYRAQYCIRIGTHIIKIKIV